jgi:hypothetical protein
MLAKGMLNSAGIECFLMDDNTGRMLGFISNVIGGIRMKVKKVDAEAATALLEQLIPDVDVGDEENHQPPRCPKCYSADITSSNSTSLCLQAPGSAHLSLITRRCVNASRAAINGTTRTML